MQIFGIVILLSVCAVFVLANKNIVQIDRTHINSVVFCALGMNFLCAAPAKYIIFKEAKTLDKDKKSVSLSFAAFVLNVSAGIILIVLSVIKFFGF